MFFNRWGNFIYNSVNYVNILILYCTDCIIFTTCYIGNIKIEKEGVCNLDETKLRIVIDIFSIICGLNLFSFTSSKCSTSFCGLPSFSFDNFLPRKHNINICPSTLNHYSIIRINCSFLVLIMIRKCSTFVL